MSIRSRETEASRGHGTDGKRLRARGESRGKERPFPECGITAPNPHHRYTRRWRWKERREAKETRASSWVSDGRDRFERTRSSSPRYQRRRRWIRTSGDFPDLRDSQRYEDSVMPMYTLHAALIRVCIGPSANNGSIRDADEGVQIRLQRREEKRNVLAARTRKAQLPMSRM